MGVRKAESLELRVTWQGVAGGGGGPGAPGSALRTRPQDGPALSAPPSAPVHCVLSIWRCLLGNLPEAPLSPETALSVFPP